MSIESDRRILQNEILTVREVAVYLRVSRVTVWRWCQNGIIPATQVGRHWRIRRIDLLGLLNNNRALISIPNDWGASDKVDQQTDHQENRLNN